LTDQEGCKVATIIPVSRVKGTRYKAIIRLAGIKPYSRMFKTRRAAEHWARLQESDIDLARAGVDVQAQHMTLAELCDDYMLHGWKGKDQNRERHVAWWREELGQIRVRDLSKQQIRAKLRLYKAGRVRRYDGTQANRTRSPASVNRLRSALDAVLKYGRQEYDFAGNPTKDIPKEREDNERKRYLTEWECESLLAACRASSWNRLWLLVAMALTSGARQGELLRLRYKDLDLSRNRAVLDTSKNGCTRNIHLTDEVVAEIRRFPSPLNRETLLFESHKKPGKPFEFRKHWNQAVKRSGIDVGEGRDRFVFHSLRHTAASYLANQGMSLPEIGAVLGHKSQVSTNRYAHLCDQRANDLVRNVSAKLLNSAGDSNE
jgi:integrase